MKYIKPKIIPFKNLELNEQWVQAQISDDPSILGLGNLERLENERRQPGGGRLDLLLQDPDTGRRYEVEIQLGATDPSHIIRTIEYWDIERKRYPKYDHCAVLVAENVTSRFLNVVSLFNREIPLIAIQFQAVQIAEYTSLVFTTVLDEFVRGDEDEESQQPTDRAYWAQRGAEDTLAVADQLLEIVREFTPELTQHNYTKYYIGPSSQNGRPNNFVSFVPQKKKCILRLNIKRSDNIDEQIEQARLPYSYNGNWRVYNINLNKDDIDNHRDKLKELMQMAYDSKTT